MFMFKQNYELKNGTWIAPEDWHNLCLHSSCHVGSFRSTELSSFLTEILHRHSMHYQHSLSDNSNHPNPPHGSVFVWHLLRPFGPLDVFPAERNRKPNLITLRIVGDAFVSIYPSPCVSNQVGSRSAHRKQATLELSLPSPFTYNSFRSGTSAKFNFHLQPRSSQ